MKALADLAPTQALPLLRKMVKHKNPSVQSDALRTLAGLDYGRGVPLLHELASDRTYRLRSEAATELTRLAPEEALPLLRKLVVKEQDLRIRCDAAEALARL